MQSLYGVNGLLTFLEEYTKYACYRVDIQTLANDHKAKTGKNAKIVVDTLSCFPLWYADWDWYVVYEVQEFIKRARDFVESFRKLDNVELIFFTRGLYWKEIKRMWLMVMRSKIPEIHRAIECLLTCGRLPSFNLKSTSAIPVLTRDYILQYVLGCEVNVSVNDFRQELIQYAQEHQCFAIFSEDTEFVASQVDAIVLSSRQFSMKDMSALVFDRVKLAHKLGIRTEELPLLAIMAGNTELFEFTELDDFHRRICPFFGSKKPEYMLIPAIARYINKLPKNEDIDVTLTRLAQDVFNASFRVGVLKRSYNLYFVKENSDTLAMGGNSSAGSSGSTLANKQSKILSAALDRYRKALLPLHAYSVLTDQTLLCGTAFEDVRINRSDSTPMRDLPSSTVLRPLRSQIYGILLMERAAETPHIPVAVREWCHEDVKSYLEPCLVEPIKPIVHHPGLLALWSDNDDDDMNEVRWALFLTSISPSLNIAEWRSFDEEFLLATLTVNHLYNDVHYLNESELNAVLVTIATFPLYNAEKLSSLPYGDYIPRAFNIIITLTRTFGLVITVLAICGFPVKMSEENAYLKFEFKVFQKMYVEVIQKEVSDIESLCENNVDYFKLFNRMKGFITGMKDEESE